LTLTNGKTVSIGPHAGGSHIFIIPSSGGSAFPGPEFGPGYNFALVKINGGGFIVFAELGRAIYRRAYNENIEPIPITDMTPIP